MGKMKTIFSNTLSQKTRGHTQYKRYKALTVKKVISMGDKSRMRSEAEYQTRKSLSKK